MIASDIATMVTVLSFFVAFCEINIFIFRFASHNKCISFVFRRCDNYRVLATTSSSSKFCIFCEFFIDFVNKRDTVVYSND